MLGPLAVLGLALGWLAQVRDSEDVQAEENAGLVFNGQVRAGGAVAAMDAVMAREPEVVLIGPSYANTDLRRDKIAAHLGIPTSKVALLSIPNSVGAHWYAVLKYRVYGQGHRPKLVVVVSGLQSMLLTTPLTESSWVNLRVQLDDPADPVVADKAQGGSAIWVGRLREQRGKARDRVMGALRDVPPRLVLGSSVREGGMGPIEVRERLDAVFADEKLSMDLHTQRSTPAGIEKEERAWDPSVLPAPEDGFLRDITALAAEHGSRVVWVRPPMSPVIPAELDDVAPDGFQQRAVAVVHEEGGAFLDMRRLPMTREMFKNEDHMNAEGSLRFSEALGKALSELDALQPEAKPGTPPFEASEVVVEPAPPALPEAEASWEGQGTWVAPGTALHLRFDRPWTPDRGVFAVKLSAEQLGPDGAAPQLEVAGERVRLAAADATAGWRLWRAERVLDPPDGPFEVVFTVPEGGPWIRVTGVAVGRRDGRTVVSGTPAGVDGASARLLGVVTERDGQRVDATVLPTWPDPPDKVPHDGKKTDLPGRRLAQFDTPRWQFLSDEYLMGQSAFGSRCSPLRVTEDRVPLARPNVPCVEVQRFGEGRTCHTPDALVFAASDGTDPARNGRKYRMVLDPERRCDTAVWLYPKDRFTVRWPADRLAAFERGATHFTLGARYLQKRPAKIRVVLRVDGEVRLDTEIQGRDLYDRPAEFRLDPPLPPGTTDVELEVENLEHTFYLVEELALSEGPLPVQDTRWQVLPD